MKRRITARYNARRMQWISTGQRSSEGSGTETHNEMVGRRIGRLQVAVYGTQRYLKKTVPPRSAADLAGHRLILSGENLSHIASAKWLKKLCKSGEPVYRAISMVPMLAAVRNGMGLASVPCYLGMPKKASFACSA